MHNRTKSFELNPPTFWHKTKLCPILLASITILIVLGLFILYSASNQQPGMLIRQISRFLVSFVVLVIFSQIPPQKYQIWAPWLFGLCLSLLIAVLIVGKIGKGAQRWLDLGIVRFQPSEVMKIVMPMMLAWFFQDHRGPIQVKTLAIALAIIFIPAFLIIKQPDLGTALMVTFSGFVVLFFAGLSYRFIASLFLLSGISAPFLWHHLHDYQKQRVLTFLNPESDPLGNGYHIIQSKIAIGSGGLLGKGWLNGTQSHLHFLPENATDFIFAVIGEEFGILGCLVFIVLFAVIIARCLQIAMMAPNSFTRLLAISLTMNFFLSAFVNMGMVTGMLPVVGIPLPLVSYGGSSMIVTLASFGMIMAIYSKRALFKKATL